MKRSCFALLAAAGVLALTPPVASAQTWTTWTSMAPGTFDGSLLGAVVSFAGGDIGGNLSNSGIDYYAPNAPYMENGLTSPDAGGNTGFIQFDQPASGAFTFSSAFSDVYVAFISVGQTGVPVSYTFDHPFTVVSDNTTNCAYWSCGTYSVSGNTIQGREFSGTVEFTGPINELSFVTDNPEYWHGVTVGADSISPAPEPASLALMATGLVGIAGCARVRRKRLAVN